MLISEMHFNNTSKSGDDERGLQVVRSGSRSCIASPPLSWIND